MRIGKGEFLLGDCLDVLPTLADGSVDMILADLPYGTTRNKWDAIIPFEPLWREYWRVCRPGAAIVLTAQTPFDKALGASQLQHLRYEWIWEKTEATGHLNAKRSPMKAHENILVFYRGQPTYNPIKTTGHIRKTARQVSARVSNNYGAQRERGEYDSTERYPRSVITFSTDKQTGAWHETQKPVALFEYLIRTYTDPGMTVLDNVAGSGTTAIAAERTGRNWVCIERDPEYYRAATLRAMVEVLTASS